MQELSTFDLDEIRQRTMSIETLVPPVVVLAHPTSMATCILERIHQLSRCSESPDVMTRTYLSPAHHEAAQLIATWMLEAGMQVRRDAVGNVIGRYEGQTADAPALLTGSHFDTVRNAGLYDGNLGILAPISCVAEWHANGVRFPHAVEVIAFSEEEGVRFRSTLLGSRALAGTFDMTVLAHIDDDGTSMRDAIDQAQLGFDCNDIAAAAYRREQALAFVEVHIEQGPVLLNEDLALGVVSAISGARRFVVNVLGQAGHAGTVPMTMRKDALTAAAEMVLYIEQRCSAQTGLVGTVGQFSVTGGAPNVVPGHTCFSIDIRAENTLTLETAAADVLQHIRVIAARRGVDVKWRPVHASSDVVCAPALQRQMAAALERAGMPVRYLQSGAGHDAMAMAAITDVCMLFVRCGNGGISHHPDEIVTIQDIAAATGVLSDFIEHFQPA